MQKGKKVYPIPKRHGKKAPVNPSEHKYKLVYGGKSKLISVFVLSMKRLMN